MVGWKGLVFSAVLLILAGCASTLYDQGRRRLAQEDYAGAVELLQAALAATPEDVALRVDLATALYRQGALEQAQGQLEQVLAREADNGQAMLILGLIHEKRGDRQAAIAVYRGYAQLTPLSKARRLVEARLEQLVREQIQAETREALAQEAVLEVAAIPDNAVAVAPFHNLGADRSLDPLQKGLAAMMITDLAQVERLQVVERLRMQEMMQEIGLGMTGAVDPQSAPRLGKLLGASQVVTGSFADLAEGEVRLDISAAGIKSGTAATSDRRGPLEKLFRLQKELTLGLLEAMGIALTEAERQRILELPTENLLAFIAYSRGLDLEDRGQPQAALEAYQEALSLDAGFGAVQAAVERLEMAPSGAVDLKTVETGLWADKKAQLQESGSAPAGSGAPGAGQAGSGDPRLERLRVTGARTGAGFIPAGQAIAVGEGAPAGASGQVEVREAEEERRETETAQGVRVRVVVPVPK